MRFCYMLKCGWNLKIMCKVKKTIYKRTYTVWLYLRKISRIGKSLVIESRLAVAYHWGRWIMWSHCKWVWGFFLGWWNVLNMDYGMMAQLCEHYNYIKKYIIWVNYIWKQLKQNLGKNYISKEERCYLI